MRALDPKDASYLALLAQYPQTKTLCLLFPNFKSRWAKAVAKKTVIEARTPTKKQDEASVAARGLLTWAENCRAFAKQMQRK